MIAIFVAIQLAVVAFLLMVFRDLGYKQGFRDGHKAADEWWMLSEVEVYKAKEKLSWKGEWI